MNGQSAEQGDEACAEDLLLETSRFRVVEAPARDGRPRKALIRHPGSVCILPVLADGRLCLIRNYRLSVARRLIEVPAGTLEPPEPPAECARRELQEETGYQAAHWTKLGEMYLAPGLLDERAHVFLAEQLSPGPQRLEPDEQIEVFLAEWPQVDAMIDRGEIQDAKTLATVGLWRRRLSQRN